MTPPAGSVPFNSAWARNHTPTVAQFTAWDYGPTDAARETARLEAERLARIAHETWVAPDSDQADMVLLQFKDPTGALSRFLGATTAEADAAGVRPFAVPSVAGALGYYHTALDSVGNVRAVLYATVGDTVVEEFYFSPARLRPADAIAWLGEQVKLLR